MYSPSNGSYESYSSPGPSNVLQEQIDTLVKEKLEMFTSKAQTDYEKFEALEEASGLRVQVEGMQEQLKEVDQLKADNINLREDLSHLGSKTVSLEQQLQAQSATMNALSKENVELQRLLSQAGDSGDGNAWEAEKMVLQERINALEQDNSNLSELYQGAMDNLSKHKENTKKIRGKNRKFRNDMKALAGEAEKLQSEMREFGAWAGAEELTITLTATKQGVNITYDASDSNVSMQDIAAALAEASENIDRSMTEKENSHGVSPAQQKDFSSGSFVINSSPVQRHPIMSAGMR